MDSPYFHCNLPTTTWRQLSDWSYVPFFNTTPSTRDIFDRIWGLGMALPLSYSWIVCGFSLICCASWACVSFLSVRALMICCFSSLDTFTSACRQAAHQRN